MSSSAMLSQVWLSLLLLAGCSSGSVGGTVRGEKGHGDGRPAQPDARGDVDGSGIHDTQDASSAADHADGDASTPGTPLIDPALVDAGTKPDESGSHSPKQLDSRAIQIDKPFSVAPSAASSRILSSWIGDIASIGVQSVRNFEVEKADERLATIAEHNLDATGTLLWSASSPQTFPVDDLTGWRAYVRALVHRCKGQVKHWEVWNEPPNFSENKSPRDYSRIVVAAYEEVKAVDPSLQVGLAASSNNVAFLDQALAAGAAGHFDYVAIHPYELLDLLRLGWEPVFMRVVPTLRRMLAARDPGRTNAPIWFTEIGQPVTASVTPSDQADSLVKAYTLGLAQGVARIAWFEGIDGDSGPFGLIDANGEKRPAYTALRTLISQLGPNPRYFGWVLLNDRHYGFAFETAGANILVAWGRPNMRDAVVFDTPVRVITPSTGVGTDVSMTTLTPSPVIIAGIGAKLVETAIANRTRPFPWSGDATAATGNVVSTSPAMSQGLHALDEIPTLDVQGERVFDLHSRTSISFAVDPNFLSYDPVELQVTAILQRIGTTDAGFTLKYESIHGFKSSGIWNTIPSDQGWLTMMWTLSDSAFVGNWGYNFKFDSDSTDHSQYMLKSVSVTKR